MVFLYTMSPSNEQNMSSNRGYQLVRFPRKIITKKVEVVFLVVCHNRLLKRTRVSRILTTFYRKELKCCGLQYSNEQAREQKPV